MKIYTLKENPLFRYVTFFYLYLMQGIPAGFALTTLANYFLANGIAPQNVGGFIAIFGIPWTLQFIWGPLIDRFQYSVMGHRKQWVVLSQLMTVVASTGLLLVKEPLRELPLLSTIFFVYSIFASIGVASIDAMAITIAPGNERGRLNGCMRGGYLLGAAFGAAGLSSILHSTGFEGAVLVQTIVLSVFTIAFFFTRIEYDDVLLPWQRSGKKRVQLEDANPALAILFKRVYAAISNKKSAKYFSLVATVYFCSSVFIRSYTYYLINVLKWPDKTVSLLQGSWGSIVTFSAIVIAGVASDKVGAKKLQIRSLWAVCFFFIILNVSYQFWHYKFYAGSALILWNIADPLLSVTTFPILMGLCWRQVEGSQFTTYLAILNLCDVIGSYTTGWCVNFIPVPILGVSCGLILLLIMLLVKWKGNYQLIPD